MINVTTRLPVVWSPPAAQAVSAVPAVAAIRPLQESGRNGQSGAGTDPEAQATRLGRRRSESDAAPILPRKSPDDQGGGPGGTRASSAATADLQAQADAEQRVEQDAAQRAADEARRQQMQAVLTNVWKASAAVVDRVLGRDDVAVAVAPSAPNPAGDTTQVSAPVRSSEQLELPWPVQEQAVAVPAAMAEDRAPVAYDARGHSSLAPLEPGALISHRV